MPVSGRDSSGCSLVLYSYDPDSGGSLYCPNSIVGDSSGANGVGCAEGLNPISVPDGNVIINKGLLENASCAVNTLNPTAPAAAITASSTSTNSSLPRCTSDNSKDSGSSSRDAAIGAGVGVPLGVLALASVGWALFERKKRYHPLSSVSQPIVHIQQDHKANLELPDTNQIPHELEGDRAG